MRHYDIFVSYRRSSYETANLIATRLRAAGYSVFFDIETLRSGKFNEQLYEVIDNCRDFVVVLPPNALDRCVSEDDWVRLEVCRAMERNKNIIPVMLNGFVWPEPMPVGMEELKNYQALTAGAIEYFDLAMERLQSYLHSRKRTKFRIFIRWFGAISISLCIFLVVLLSVCRFVAKPLCKEVVDHLTLKIGVADFLMSDNDILADTWKTYKPTADIEMRENLDLVSKNIAGYQDVLDLSLELSSWQRFLLFLYRISAQELTHIEDYITFLADEMVANIQQISTTTSKEHILPSDYTFIEEMLNLYPCMGSAIYYSYLQVLNNLPESALEGYRELAPQFINMPKTGLGLRQSEYEILAKQAYEGVNSIYKDIDDNLDGAKDDLHKDEMMLDSIHKGFLAQYRAIVENAVIKAEASPEENWGRVLILSALLDLSIDLYAESIADGVNPGYVTPELVLSDLNKALDDFKVCHNDAEYVVAAKAFYQQVVEGTCAGGVLVTQFMPNTTHEVYKVGDIIIEWNGHKVNNVQELKSAYAKSPSGKMKLLRLDNGELKELATDIPGNEDIVSFCNLIEPEDI